MAKRLVKIILPFVFVLFAGARSYGIDYVLKEDDSYSRLWIKNTVSAASVWHSDSTTSSELFFTKSVECSADGPNSGASAELSAGFRCIFSPDQGNPTFHTPPNPWPVDMDMSIIAALNGSGSTHGDWYEDASGELHYEDASLACDLIADANLSWTLMPQEPGEYVHMPVRVRVWANYSLSDSSSNAVYLKRSFITNLSINDDAIGPLYSYWENGAYHFNRWLGPNPLETEAIILPLGETLRVKYDYEFHLRGPKDPGITVTESHSSWHHPLDPTDLYICAKAQPYELLSKIDKAYLRQMDLLDVLQNRLPLDPALEEEVGECALVDGACADGKAQLIFTLDFSDEGEDIIKPYDVPGDTENPTRIHLMILSPDGKDNGYLIREGGDRDQDGYDDTPRIADGLFTQTWCPPAAFDNVEGPSNTAKERQIPVQIDIDRDADGSYDYTFIEYITLENCCCSGCKVHKALIEFSSRPLSPAQQRRLTRIQAKSGERLEAWWVVPSNDAARYELRYYSHCAGEKLEDGAEVGHCCFQHGCNGAWYYYCGDDPHHPDCFVSTVWKSADFGDDDPDPETGAPPDGLLDVLGFYYDICSNKVSKVHSKHMYMCGPPVFGWPDFCAPITCAPIGPMMWVHVLDPPLGPETDAMFDELLTGLRQLGLSPDETMMGCAVIPLCDMDWDGHCDSGDLQIVQNAIGKCWEEMGYYPLADIDGDGCVSDSDIELIFGLNQADFNNDGFVDFSDFAVLAAYWLNPNCEDANNWCDATDLNQLGTVDMHDLVLLINHWLEGVAP